MAESSPRYALPLLQAGQAQKEAMHNEAIVALELLAQPIVETMGDAAPPAAPVEGASWIVGPGPTGAWAGHAAALASWTTGGWRFVAPVVGTSAFVKASGRVVRYAGGGWSDGVSAAIADPAGGTTADAQARTAIAAILATLRTHGLIMN